MGAGEGGGASAPSLYRCIEEGCPRAQWADKHRGRIVVLSNLCFEHANAPMLEVVDPGVPFPKPRPGKGEPKTFKEAVERRRLEQERVGRALGLLLQGGRQYEQGES